MAARLGNYLIPLLDAVMAGAGVADALRATISVPEFEALIRTHSLACSPVIVMMVVIMVIMVIVMIVAISMMVVINTINV